MKLRNYSSADERQLADIWYESWISVGLDTPIVTKAEMAERLGRELANRWDVTIAEVAGGPVGFLALAMAEQRLDQLFVAPGSQGRGIGHALFQVAIERFPDGFWLATQPANVRARAFYERQGMKLDRIEPGLTEERAFYVFPGAKAFDRLPSPNT